MNVNEAPNFTLSSYSGTIAENSVNGVDIMTIPATDPDSGDSLTYSLSGSGEVSVKGNAVSLSLLHSSIIIAHE